MEEAVFFKTPNKRISIGTLLPPTEEMYLFVKIHLLKMIPFNTFQVQGSTAYVVGNSPKKMWDFRSTKERDISVFKPLVYAKGNHTHQYMSAVTTTPLSKEEEGELISFFLTALI